MCACNFDHYVIVMFLRRHVSKAGFLAQNMVRCAKKNYFYREVYFRYRAVGYWCLFWTGCIMSFLLRSAEVE
jgi:hypothetical protein